MRTKGISIVMRQSPESLRGSVLVAGFPGFGRIGYVVPRYLASALSLSKVGYVLTPRLPSMIIMEDDGIGFPFELYAGNGVLALVNRAVPEPVDQNAYCSEVALWASQVGVKYAILVGGLSRDYEPPEEKYGYRWLHNRLYEGPKLQAPLMEEGLGVVGPLALLHIYLEHYGVPTVMVLPYSAVDTVDYDAALVGMRVIVNELLGIKVPMDELEKLAEKQKEELEKISDILSQEREGKQGGTNIFM
ncbi:hypothetical protein ASAC_0307 [Acidilobus saccharovorans 345-15]|uniref:Proteasome assembly chaperone family protein n=1 Tax=Acidilobus saccharovorans (strain DSM 16705 / JCM 18335 / VKM B-2471 / 345-15) TaxID=666510 RepID=D9Q076_ACIS3|nr:PAC2 family protein [Acidilobus saccharovorans]ADL18714.1 hypothetical protein ASAC_0307 [Acidilobus saccharovorans 345-15]